MNTDNAHILLRENAVKPIHSLTPFTLLDYPDKTACILWFAGCNMRCSYCYNPDIVLGKGKIEAEEIYNFLDKRKGLLDGVVFSGGECTLHPSFFPMLQKIKSMGFAVKIDTNGSKPEILEKAIKEHLVDYVAMDFKALPHTFENITNSSLFDKFERSLFVLNNAPIPFEVRTTVHTELISENDLKQMIQYLEKQNYTGNYYVQFFRNEVPTIGNLTESKRFKENIFSTETIQIHFREA